MSPNLLADTFPKINPPLKEMKFVTSDVVFGFSWDQVVAAFWKRYPNPFSTHVLSEDVYERRIEGDKLFTKRIIFKTDKKPKWTNKFISNTSAYVIEESIVDLVTKSFVTYSRNISMQRVMSIEEKCRYVPNIDDPKTHTLCKKETWVNSRVPGFSRLISSFGASRIKKNTKRAEIGLQFVLNKLYVPEYSKNTELLEQKLKEEYGKDWKEDFKNLPKKKIIHQTSCDSDSKE